MRASWLAFVLCCSLPQCLMAQHTVAQEQEHAPLLNAFGRFWGIGYSAGYHARTDSRLGLHHYSPTHNVVPQPPRGLYANPNLYAGGAIPNAMSYAHAMPMNGSINMPTPAPALVSPQNQNIVPAPPKPVDPPPNWLKQYIKPNGEGDKNRSDELLNESSPSDRPNDRPSDRRGVMLAPSPEDSTTSLSITPAQPTVQIGGRPVISVLQQ